MSLLTIMFYKHCNCQNNKIMTHCHLLKHHHNALCHVYLIYCIKHLKGTPLRCGRVTHSKRFFSKSSCFMLVTCAGHISLVKPRYVLYWLAIHLKPVLYLLINRYLSIFNRVAKSMTYQGTTK